MGKMIAMKKAFPCLDYPISFHMAYIEISPIMRFLFFYFLCKMITATIGANAFLRLFYRIHKMLFKQIATR